MKNLIKKNMGYHRLLLCICVLLLFIIYPTDETTAAIRSWKEGSYTFWFFPISIFLVLVWVVLSDLVANLWRLAEFMIKKNGLWHFGPLTVDLVLVLLLWLFYHFHLVPKVEEPQTTESMMLILRHLLA